MFFKIISILFFKVIIEINHRDYLELSVFLVVVTYRRGSPEKKPHSIPAS